MIHETAIVDPSAELGAGVTVGAFAMVEAGVRIGAGTVLHPRAHVGRGTVLGEGNVVHIGAVLGRTPDGQSADDDGPGLIAGRRNEFRENTSVLRGSIAAPTVIGDENYIMGGARIGAGARVGDGATIAPYVVMAQRVQVDDSAFISGNVVLHQGVRVGRLAFVSGLSAVHRDVPPFMIAGGRPAVTVGHNRTGLRRAGLSSEAREALKQAFKRLFRSEEPADDALRALATEATCDEVRHLVAFIQERRGIEPAVEDQLFV